MMKPNPLVGTRTFTKIAWLAPFFMGAALYISIVLSFFSALPILFVHLRFGRFWGIIASVTNLAIIWYSLGSNDAAYFFVIAVVLATTTAEALKQKLSLEKVTILSVTMMLVASIILIISYASQHHIGVLDFGKQLLDGMASKIIKQAEEYKNSGAMNTQDLDRMLVDPEVTKRNLIETTPIVILISALVITVSNLLLCLKLNFGKIRNKNKIPLDYFKNWKAPDHMIWPTLAAGFCIVIEVPGTHTIAITLFRLFMAIYCIQGLSILRFFFDHWKMKGMFRPLAYTFAVFFLLPLVVSLGFFDLWFSFRERYGAA